MMTLHLGMANEGSDTGGRTQDHVCDLSAKIRCPHDPGVGICVRLCVYGFGIVQIAVYDMGGCHMSVVIDPRLLLQLWYEFYDVFSVFSG